MSSRTSACRPSWRRSRRRKPGPGRSSSWSGSASHTAIARALINDPALILADEPTGNLDSRNGRIVIDLLAQLNRESGRTVVVATHSDLADALATVHIRLRDGAIADSPCHG